MVGSSFLFARKWTKKTKMYLHKTKNENYTPPCCYFSGELEVVEGIRHNGRFERIGLIRK